MTETTMTAEVAASLRAGFDEDKIGKLPKVTCTKCRRAQSRVCDDHAKQRCDECGNWITTAHLHLDYVGHADVTDRLLAVDPTWSWEPVAFDEHGLPALDQFGGMWIRLTVAGVTRLGYGDADGKQGGNAVKEAIGDALRNAAMRFGVALDLWRKELPVDESTNERRRATRRAPTQRERATARANPGKAAVDLFGEIEQCQDIDDLESVWNAIAAAHTAGDLTDAEKRQLSAHVKSAKAKLGGKR